MTAPAFAAGAVRRTACAAVILFLLPGQARGQGVDAPDLSLEALMQVRVEPVFGASLRVQPMTEAPASVTIVTADDIARHGYETIGDILADVRGFHITNDRNYSYLGARGFALPGDYSTRVLLLVDGHRINDAIYEQSTAGRDMAIDVAAIERVEVIRGPASALYGTSAFFAVINVVTRSGQRIDGLEATVQGGSLGARTARVVAGRAFDNGVDAAMSATIGRRTTTGRLYFEEFDAPDTNNGIADGLDDEAFRQLSGRVTLGAFTVTGAAASRDKQVPTAPYDTVFGDPRLTTVDARAFVNGRYDRTFEGTRVTVQSSIDRYRYEGSYPYWSDDPLVPAVVLSKDYAAGRWWTAGARMSRRAGARHTITAGLELRNTFHEVQGVEHEADADASFVVSNTSHVLGLYAQNEMTIRRNLLVTAGLRYDRYAGFDRVTPRVAVVVKRSDDEVFKYLFGNAFRAPNTFELDYYSQPVRRLDLRPETITSHEVVWERYTGRWLRTSAAAYVNTIDDLIGFTGMGDVDYRFENIGRVRSRGLELEAEARHRSGVRAQVSYVLQEAIDRDAEAPLTNSPRHALKVQASANGPWRSTAALSVRFVGRRLALDGSAVDTMAPASLSVRVPIRRGVHATALARNVLGHEYAHPGSAEHLQRVIPQDGRTVIVGLEWKVARRR